MPRPMLLADLCVGTVLRDARLRLGLTLAEVGARIGVNGNLIGIWERGAERLPVARRAALAGVLGLDPDTLLPPGIVAVSQDEAAFLAIIRDVDAAGRASLMSVATAIQDGRSTA